MAWGFITTNGPGKLVFLDQNMNQHIYIQVLKDCLIPFLKSKKRNNVIFHQDVDHTTRRS